MKTKSFMMIMKLDWERPAAVHEISSFSNNKRNPTLPAKSQIKVLR